MICNDTVALATKLGALLRAKNWTVSCAESCTGGGVGYAITSVSGSSAWFNQGYLTYSNQAKQRLLGVSQHTLANYGAVSAETVIEMATGCATQSGANITVAISGIAGPDGGSADKPVGTVWFGFYQESDPSQVAQHCISEVQYFAGDRSQVRTQAVDFALQRLCQLLA